MSKILYIWKSEYPWDVRVEKICKALYCAGHSVTILSRWGGSLPYREAIDGLNIIRAGYNKRRFLFEPVPNNPFWKKAIDSAVNEINPDLIIVREIMLAEEAARSARTNNIPVIMDMAEHYPAAMKDWKKYRETFIRRMAVHTLNLPEKTEKRSVVKMDGIISVCSEQNQRLNRQYNYPYDNIEIVHNTPDLDFFKDIKQKSPDKPRIFGHHGHMTAEKSIETLIRGFIIAAKKNQYIELHLAGAGESFEDMKRIAEASDCSDKIKFLGVYHINELPGILSSFDVGVIPYQVSDFNNYTIHNKLFDFFAAGKPVIVSEAAPLKRVVNDSNAGIVIDCSNPEIIAENILIFENLDYDFFAQNSYNAARNLYNWREDSKRLINFVGKYL